MGKNDVETLASIGILASTFWNQGRWKEAEELEVQVMETSSRVLGLEHPRAHVFFHLQIIGDELKLLGSHRVSRVVVKIHALRLLLPLPPAQARRRARSNRGADPPTGGLTLEIPPLKGQDRRDHQRSIDGEEIGVVLHE